jgi:hypothetical protein
MATDLTLPFEGTGGFPSGATNQGAAFLITNNAAGNSITGVSSGFNPALGVFAVSIGVHGMSSAVQNPEFPGPLGPLISIGVRTSKLNHHGGDFSCEEISAQQKTFLLLTSAAIAQKTLMLRTRG